MSRTLHRGSLLAVLWLAACSQTPTAPSPTPTLADSASSGVLSSWSSQSNGIAVADWACLTRGVGCPLRAELDMLPAEDVPGAPSNLASQTSGSTIVLTWSAPAGGGVASYVIEAGTAAGQTNIASFNTGSTATTLTVTTVPNGTYFVRVRARNADGTSGPSNEVTIVVGGGGCQLPGAPAGFTASATGNSVTLAWGSVAGAVSFIIEAGSSPGGSNIVVVETGSAATSFTANAPNGTYYLRVRVRTACGTSAASNEAALTIGVTQPPGNLVTGRWLGLVANGEGATSTPNDCGIEKADLQLDLVQNGASLTGTITLTMRVSTCPPSGGSTSATGTVSGDTISLTGFPDLKHRIDVTGTISGTRMTGRLVSNGGVDGDSTFVINKQ